MCVGKMVSASGRKALSKPEWQRVHREYESRWPDGRCDNSVHHLDDGELAIDDDGYDGEDCGDSD